jgi:penicillin amidase
MDADGDGYYDEPATALFRSFVEVLIQQTLSDDLGEVFPYFVASGYPTKETPTGSGTNLPPGVKAIIEALEGSAGYDLFNGESAESVVESAMRETLGRLDGRGLPVAPRPFSTRNFLGIPQAGEDELMVAPFEQNRGTENNMIVMQRDAIVAWEVAPPGQSGFISPDGAKAEHYDDQFELYHQFGRKRVWFYADDVQANKKSEITLNY